MLLSKDFAKAIFDAWEAAVLAEELFDVRNRVLFYDFPEHGITRDLTDPAHEAVYTALANYVITNFERKQ